MLANPAYTQLDAETEHVKLLECSTVILNDKTSYQNVVSEAPRQMFFQKKQSDGNHSTNPKCIVAATN